MTSFENTPVAPVPVIDGSESIESHDENAVAVLSASIDVHSAHSISEFGRKLGDRTAAYTDSLLEKAKIGDLDQAGSQLTEIVLRAQEFDIESLENAYGRVPLIGGFLKKLSMNKARTVAKFDSVKEQIERMVSSVANTATMLKQRNENYQEMYEGVKSEYSELGLYVEATKLAIERVGTEIVDLGEPGGELDKAEALAVLQAGRQALEKRRDDLSVLKHSAMQMMPMVRVIQYNNLSLMDKFNTIQTLTLPAWKRTFLMWLALEEQKETVELANSIDDATNKFMKANADLLHQNSVETARSSQNLVIDIDTLKHVHDKIIDTLNDVQTVHEEGAVARAEAIRDLETMRTKMLAGEKMQPGGELIEQQQSA